MQTLQEPTAIDISDGRVHVTARTGANASTVVVERTTDTAVAPTVPIGTRRAEHLTMTIDGAPIRLRPGPGRWARGSYKVTVVHAGVQYQLRPKSPDTSRLTRDGQRLGDFQRTEHGDVNVTWHTDTEVSAVDTAVGHALAAAFGTGARLFFVMLLEVLGAAVPD